MSGGRWRVWIEDSGRTIGGAAAWRAIAEELVRVAAPLHRSKHAATYRWERRDGDVYLKVYHRYRALTALKDCLRSSKARHLHRTSARLAAAGFCVPRVLAAAEERRGLVLGSAWVATAALAGEPVGGRLAALAAACRGASGARREALWEKRAVLAAIGAETARLHDAGFVAGDLVPANVWVVATPAGPCVALLDHDRTRAWRTAAPWWRARRNLVQLNRVVLPGVTATDRLRVYRAYAAERGWPRALARRRLGWIVARTIARRQRCDGVVLAPGPVDFRLLMRADGPFAPPPPGAGGRSAPGGHAGPAPGERAGALWS